MSRDNYLYCVFLFIVFSFSAHSQEKPLPLKQILREVEGRHNVSFSYLEEDVAPFTLLPPQRLDPLPQKIAYLKRATNLEFSSTNGTHYIISRIRKQDRNICGYLVDDDTSAPLGDAVITGAVSTTSDEKGYFVLPYAADSLEVRFLGYRTKRISPADFPVSGCATIRLQPETMNLDEVVAQRFIATGISKGRSGGFKLRPSQFGILPGLTEPDVLQTMQQLPGIYSADEIVSNINIRGGTHDQNLFLWNGVRMYQTGHFFGLISGFNPNLAQSIAIVKNGSSAFYGESVSGVVDISSQSVDGQKPYNSISVNTLNGEAHAFVKIDQYSDATVSARRSFTDFLKSPAYRSYRDRIFQNSVITNFGNTDANITTNEDFYFYDITAQYQRKMGRHVLHVDGIGMRNALEAAQSDGIETTRNVLHQQNIGGAAGFRSTWSEQLQTSAQAYVSAYKLDGNSNTPGSGLELDQRNEVLDIGLRLRADYRQSEQLHLSAGYQFNETGVTSFDNVNSPAFTRTITELIRTHSVIGETTYYNADRSLFVLGGIRINYFDKLGTLLAEPRAQLSYAFSNRWQLEVLAEMKSQTLSQVIDRQQDFLGIEKRRWIIANNDNVPLQQSAQFSAGLTFKDRGWLISAESFVKNVDGITTSSQGFQDELLNGRADGSCRIAGIELLFQKQYKRFYGWISYTFNNSTYRFDDLVPAEFTNSYEIRHSINSAVVYEWRGLKLALGNRWHTGRPYTGLRITDGQTGLDTPNTRRLDPYLQTSFSAAKKWNLSDRSSVELGMSVLNVFNTRNVINRFYRIDGDDAIRIDTYSLKRTPNVNLRVIF